MVVEIIKSEWLKLRAYRAFWLLMGLTVFSYPGLNVLVYAFYDENTKARTQGGQLLKMLVGNPFSFPEVFHTTTYLSSFFTFIPAILVIMIITNEYQFKTHRQNIIDGWTKTFFIWGKFIIVFLLSLIVSVFLFMVSLLLGIIAGQAGENLWAFDQMRFSLLFFLQTFGQLSIAFLMGIVFRKAFIAYGIFIFYDFILEGILMGIFKWKTKSWGIDIGQFLPFEVTDRLIPPPPFIGRLNQTDYTIAMEAVGKHVAYAGIQVLLVWVISFLIFKKRDL